MTREEQAIEYIKKYRKLDENLYNTAPKGTVSSIATKKCLEFWDMAIQALSQEPNRDMEEIAEIIKSDADAETKCKMISNILTAKPHYFAEQSGWEEMTVPCENCGHDMTNQEKFIQTFGIDVWQRMIVFSGVADQFVEFWTSVCSEPSRITLDDVKRFATENNYALLSKDIYSQAIKAMDETSRRKGKWDRLYSWLNDMRLGIAPDETVTDIDERHCRESQTDILDEIMEWMEKAEMESEK